MSTPKSNCTHFQHPLCRNRGFSLLEVLVAVLVLAIGLLGLAALQGLSVQGNHSANMRTQATFLAYEIVDAMRANRDVALKGDYNLALNATPSAGTVAGDDLTDWRARVATALPAGNSAIALNADVFTITVEWNDTRSAANADLQQLTVQTRL